MGDRFGDDTTTSILTSLATTASRFFSSTSTTSSPTVTSPTESSSSLSTFAHNASSTISSIASSIAANLTSTSAPQAGDDKSSGLTQEQIIGIGVAVAGVAILTALTVAARYRSRGRVAVLEDPNAQQVLRRFDPNQVTIV